MRLDSNEIFAPGFSSVYTWFMVIDLIEWEGFARIENELDFYWIQYLMRTHRHVPQVIHGLCGDDAIKQFQMQSAHSAKRDDECWMTLKFFGKEFKWDFQRSFSKYLFHTRITWILSVGHLVEVTVTVTAHNYTCIHTHTHTHPQTHFRHSTESRTHLLVHQMKAPKFSQEVIHRAESNFVKLSNRLKTVYAPKNQRSFPSANSSRTDYSCHSCRSENFQWHRERLWRHRLSCNWEWNEFTVSSVARNQHRFERVSTTR